MSNAVARCTMLGLALLGCGKDVDGAPDLRVDPAELRFGALADGESEEQAFTMSNAGDAALHVTSFAVEGDGFAIVGDPDLTLAPGDSSDVTVEFAPTGGGSQLGRITIASDDPEVVTVELVGEGDLPELQVDPASWTFDDLAVPCADAVELTLTNVGTQDLVVTDAAYTSSGLLSFDPAQLALPLVLAPGESRVVAIDAVATEVGEDAGRLDLTSNDPRGTVSADQQVTAVAASTVTETFDGPGAAAVDVLLLIDYSCSMAEDNTAEVEVALPALLDTLNATADWHLLEVSRSDACGTGGVLDASIPDLGPLLVDHAFDSGPVDPWYLTEALLELGSLALEQTAPGGCNEGFLRPGASLRLITISDEKEHSGQPASVWVADYESYGPSSLVVSAVGDVNQVCGDGTGMAGYDDAVALTGGDSLDICAPGWGADFADLATVGSAAQTYALAQEATPGSIEVDVDGVPTTDFTYADGAVTIASPPIAEGDTVTVRYAPLGSCG